MEPVQAWDGSREPLCPAEQGLASSFLTQFMFRTEPLAGQAGISRGCPAAWSSSAQLCGNPGCLKGLCVHALISMAVSSGNWSAGGKLALCYQRLRS